MAMTLRDLRNKATELKISFTKETPKEDLEALIAAELAGREEATEVAPPVRTPVVTSLAVPAPVVEPPPAVETPISEEEKALDAKLDVIFPEEGPRPALRPPSAPSLDLIPSPPTREEYRPLQARVAIREADLETEFLQQPALYERISSLEAIAQAKVLSAKLRAEVTEAELYKEIRIGYEAKGAKPTEKMVEKDVITDPRYKEVQEDFINTKASADMARAIKDGFQHRRDMLIQLGSSRRQRLEGLSILNHEKAKELLRPAA